MFSRMRGWLCNCFWLLVPILIFNLLFARQLPAAFQADIFWQDIPKAISVPENIFRTIVMMLPILMKLRVSTRSERLGLGIYLAGIVLYFASWAALIVFPQGTWSSSGAGFLAPAYTPMIWLIGIGLMGNQLQISSVPFNRWTYWSLSATFLLFHNLHAFTVYSRGI